MDVRRRRGAGCRRAPLLIAAAARVQMGDGARSDVAEGAPDDGSLSRVPDQTTRGGAVLDAPVDNRSMFRVPTTP